MQKVFRLYNKHFAPEMMDAIVDAAKKVPVAPAKIGHTQVIDSNFRRADIRWIDQSNEDFKLVFDNLKDLFHKTNKESFGYDLSYLPSLQFTTYDETVQGHYDWHVDVFWQTELYYQRKLSMVIQLSDPGDYEGGELQLDEWDRPDPALLKQKGSVIIFPSFVKHRVLPVTKGTRHSLVAWIDGPLWR
jgi:PKHD-type hydroxylase